MKKWKLPAIAISVVLAIGGVAWSVAVLYTVCKFEEIRGGKSLYE